MPRVRIVKVTRDAADSVAVDYLITSEAGLSLEGAVRLERAGNVTDRRVVVKAILKEAEADLAARSQQSDAYDVAKPLEGHTFETRLAGDWPDVDAHPVVRRA